MAELTKKLHLKKNTTEHLAKAYSTTAEAGAEYITNKIDGVTSYVSIGATNDSRATVGRVKKSGSTEKAILTMGKPPYTEKSWTTAGTYTFTVPQGVTRVRVAVCGGGGGGQYGDPNRYGYAENGGDSTAFGVTATGGEKGYRRQGGTGGSPNGVNGNHAQWYTKGFALSFSLSDGDYGKGGGGDGGGEYCGGSGGYDSTYVNVVSNNTYSITVGVGGKKAQYVSRLKNGESGFVLIAYGGDI